MIKFKYKTTFLILMLFIMALTFFGCANIQVATITNEDNTIDELVGIELDELAIINAGYSVTLLKEDIKARSFEEVEKMCNNLNLKIEQDLSLDITEETKKVLKSYKDGVSLVYADWEGNSFTVGVRYASIDVYRYYYGIKEDIIHYNVENHFFYKKLYYYANTKYVLHNDLYERMKEIYSNNYAGLINSKSNQLTYTYITELRREHSDADYINKIGDKYYHTWIVDPENVTEPVIIYYNIANTGNCLLVCIGGTLGLTFILFIVAFIKNKFKKLKNTDKNT